MNTWPADIFILVPAYNAGSTLALLLPALIKQFPLKQLLVVDDGSSDDGGAVCRQFGVPIIVHERNLGKGAALNTGFTELLKRNARWIITMDSDGQHAVADLLLFLDAMAKFPETGIIIGNRDIRLSKMPFARICSNTTTSAILSVLTGRKILDSQCGFRAYSAGFLRSVTIECPRFEMETEVILKACRLGMGVTFIPVQTLYCSPQSHISHVMDTIRWIRAVVKIILSKKN